ncbi:hypothetical protein N7499_000071 [Penicillium canescens]|nr:hypothetical protein N7499_000071 [Penicillium canescens]KAJ6172905.1 hypothetical protein N7485_005717 [Penicillium canescens]
MRPHYLAGIKDADSARKGVAVATLFGACNSDAVREGTLAPQTANARVVKEITNHLDQVSFGTLNVVTNPVLEKDGGCNVTAVD